MSLIRVVYLSSFLTLATSATESHGAVSSTRSTLVGLAVLSTSTRSGLLAVVRMSREIVTPFTVDLSRSQYTSTCSLLIFLMME